MKTYHLTVECARCKDQSTLPFKWVGRDELQDHIYVALARIAFFDFLGVDPEEPLTPVRLELAQQWHALQMEVIRTRAGRPKWTRDAAVERMENLIKAHSAALLDRMGPDERAHWDWVIEQRPGGCLVSENPTLFTMRL